jgi:hypothetical protein
MQGAADCNRLALFASFAAGLEGSIYGCLAKATKALASRLKRVALAPSAARTRLPRALNGSAEFCPSPGLRGRSFCFLMPRVAAL